jgi:hypothetical protein
MVCLHAAKLRSDEESGAGLAAAAQNIGNGS